MIVGAQRAPLYNAGNPLAGHAIAFAIASASLLCITFCITLMPLICDAITLHLLLPLYLFARQYLLNIFVGIPYLLYLFPQNS